MAERTTIRPTTMAAARRMMAGVAEAEATTVGTTTAAMGLVATVGARTMAEAAVEMEGELTMMETVAGTMTAEMTTTGAMTMMTTRGTRRVRAGAGRTVTMTTAARAMETTELGIRRCRSNRA
jgi:hypothetical protein